MRVWNDGPHGSIRTVGRWARGARVTGTGEQHARLRGRRAPGRGRVVRAVLVASAALAFAPPAGALAATGYESVSAGGYHTCAAVKADDSIACWGNDAYGQVSAAPAGSYTSVSAGFTYTCAVKADGSIACWGDNIHGQTLRRRAPTSPSAPAATTRARSSPTTASPAGAGTSVGRLRRRQDPTRPSAPAIVTRARSRPTAASPAGATTVSGRLRRRQGPTSPSARVSITRARSRPTTSIACWGNNAYGQVSAAPAGSYKSVSAGGSHTCAVKADDSIACWGRNNFGQTAAPAGSYKSVSAGCVHTCAVKPDDSITCWGCDEYGQATVPGTDTDAPQVTLATPADGATYARGQSVVADYACADEAGGSGLDSCVGTVADGAAIDTATLGAHTFSVTATDDAGNDRTVSVGYTVTRPDRSDGHDRTVSIAGRPRRSMVRRSRGTRAWWRTTRVPTKRAAAASQAASGRSPTGSRSTRASSARMPSRSPRTITPATRRSGRCTTRSWM